MKIEAKELSKIYGKGESQVTALDRVSLRIMQGDFLSITGRRCGHRGGGTGNLVDISHRQLVIDDTESGGKTFPEIDGRTDKTVLPNNCHAITLPTSQFFSPGYL